MKALFDLLDVDTWAQVRKAAPKVTAVPYDAAQAAVKAMGEFIRTKAAHTDLEGRKYWEASLKELIEGSQANMEPVHMGKALRLMGLTLWRETDGYHAAWTEEQYRLLKRAMKV